VTFEIFLEKIWDNIHEIYRRPQQETKESEAETETETETETPETPDDVSLVCVKLSVTKNHC